MICASMGVTPKSVLKYLRLAGVPTRGRGSPGELNPFWKGGRRADKQGYILVHSPEHPYRNKQNLVREHRLVMEPGLRQSHVIT